ncbi:MAG: hypothetical protein Q4E35_09115 [Eubacteriales bacterium]|nr:hypothetical protein [Eubacteriales bacterium]
MELDAIAAKQTPGDGDRITIKLTVEPKPYTGTAEQIEIKNEAGNGKNVEFLDMSLWRLVNDGTPDDGVLGKIGEVEAVIMAQGTAEAVETVKTLGIKYVKNAFGLILDFDKTIRLFVDSVAIRLCSFLNLFVISALCCERASLSIFSSRSIANRLCE